MYFFRSRNWWSGEIPFKLESPSPVVRPAQADPIERVHPSNHGSRHGALSMNEYDILRRIGRFQ